MAEDVAQPLTSNQMATLAKRGAYIAVAADCYACHTTKGGAPAGGLPVATPFGTIYSTNISSDKENGIGNWTRSDFHRAVRDGIGPNGHLYPAMPYVSYRKMTPQDVDALYAYFMTRAPMKVANRNNELVFPFNVRQAMTFWNLLNLPAEATTEDSSRSTVWNRGRHLVDALAHCGECHTPATSHKVRKRTPIYAARCSKASRCLTLPGRVGAYGLHSTGAGRLHEIRHFRFGSHDQPDVRRRAFFDAIHDT
ncbi:c-type cytochrome [Ochrobactrum daejeonense]|nr:c-type cytochrome [Brucella daejeonensis]